MVSKQTQNQLAETTVELKKIQKKLTATQEELAATRKELQVRLRLGAREVTVEGYGQGQDCDKGYGQGQDCEKLGLGSKSMLTLG